MTNKPLDEQLELLQFYFKKNMLDLSIDDVVSRIQQKESKPLSLDVVTTSDILSVKVESSRTECRNYVSKACAVAHKSLKTRAVGVFSEGRHLDNIEFLDFYVCDKHWFVNFTQKHTKEEFLYRPEDKIVFKSGKSYMPDFEDFTYDFSLVGSKQLSPVSKPLHKDSELIIEFIEQYQKRRISLYSPAFGNHMVEDNLHPPYRDTFDPYAIELDEEGYQIED